MPKFGVLVAILVCAFVVITIARARLRRGRNPSDQGRHSTSGDGGILISTDTTSTKPNGVDNAPEGGKTVGNDDTGTDVWGDAKPKN